jgi:hypothetical protein
MQGDNIPAKAGIFANKPAKLLYPLIFTGFQPFQ